MNRSAKISPRDAIEWEELPSSLVPAAPRLAPMNLNPAPAAANTGTRCAEAEADPAAAWGITMPAGLDMPVQPSPFREPLRGMVMREVTEPEVFRFFFK